jgi:hypothetical protein
MAAAFAVFGVVTVWIGGPAASLSVVLFLGSAVFASFSRIVGRDAWGSAHAGAAVQALTRGRFDEVEVHHARIPASSMRRGMVARAVAVQRALLAMYRGNPEGAIAAIGPALETRTRLYTVSAERMLQASAYGVRAVAHAMKGDAAGVAADAAAAESYAEALPDAFARARLARMMIAARAGDMVALSKGLATDGSLMLENTMPRERALVRALRTMARGRGRSVYREPSRPTDGNVPGALAAWIAQVAPEAAAYAGGDAALAEQTEATTAPVATRAGSTAVAEARREGTRKAAPRRARARALFAGALAIIAVVAVALAGTTTAFEVGPDGGTSEGLAPGTFVALFCLGTVLVVTLALASQIARTRRYNLATIGGLRAAALGDLATAEALLARSKGASMPLFAAAGGAAVAAVAERSADFARSIEECDLAIAKVSSSPAAGANLLPALLATRGVALAATGRAEEALAELASLVSDHPSSAHLALTDFRIRLLVAVHAGDLDEARRVAAQRTAELPVPLRDDLLADLVVAVGPRGLPEGERERLDAELRDDATARAWIDAVAPGLRERLATRPPPRPEPATLAPEEEEEEEEEAEPQAAAEAATR